MAMSMDGLQQDIIMEPPFGPKDVMEPPVEPPLEPKDVDMEPPFEPKGVEPPLEPKNVVTEPPLEAKDVVTEPPLERQDVVEPPLEPKPLKRLKPLRACDVKGLECEIPEDEPAAETPKVIPQKGVKGAKYPLPSEPEFVSHMRALAASAEPPQYGSQGADVGKTRGHKPKVVKDSKQTERRSKKPRGVPKRSAGKKARARGQRVKKSDTTADSSRQPERTTPKSRRSRRVSKVSDGAGDGSEEIKHHGKHRTTPPHVTAHHVYSSAYRKHQALGLDLASARQAAQMAATLFREKGVVDDLCGKFKPLPRRSRNPTDVD